MFGHDSTKQKGEDQMTGQPVITEPATTSAPTMSVDSLDPPQNDQASGAPDLDQGSPPADGASLSDGSATVATQAADLPEPAATDDTSANTPPVDSELLSIKQQALHQLSPLIDHLDQTPEEKFRTTMMMIQAADNQDLIKTAYEAAQQISDEKVRAQALLDIVNEINYFTQQQQGAQPES